MTMLFAILLSAGRPIDGHVARAVGPSGTRRIDGAIDGRQDRARMIEEDAPWR